MDDLRFKSFCYQDTDAVCFLRETQGWNKFGMLRMEKVISRQNWITEMAAKTFAVLLGPKTKNSSRVFSFYRHSLKTTLL